MSTVSRLGRLPTFSLQSKILMLVLIPLLLVIVALVCFAAYDRTQDTESDLIEQRAMLIEARKRAVQDVVETAMTAIAPIVANAGPNDTEAQSRARDALRSIRFDNENYIFVYDLSGTRIVQPVKPESEGSNALDTQDAKGNYLLRDMIKIAKEGGGFYQYDWTHPATKEIVPKYSYLAVVEKWGWLLGAGVYATEVDEAMAALQARGTRALHHFLLMAALAGALIFAGVAAIAVWLVRRTVQPVRRTASAMQDIARGKGDLTRRLEVTSHDEIGELATQFNAFVARMQDTLRQVRTSTASVHQAAGEIAQGSEELATRTDQAAANLQETSASMEEITSTVNHSADSAQQANQLVQVTAEVARQGETAMQQVERTMSDIDASASRISDIITMIDSIAFQTNILALNASVEAARAGEHGRGFAVVAQEVRTLASRSGEASREIRTLIDTSVSYTRSGTELVRSAGQTMQEIVTSVARVTDVIGEISAAAREQSSGIGQVNTAVAEMDTMTQQNSAMVQQSSSAATEMRRHAEHLRALIDTFVLGDDAPASRALASRPAPAQSGATPNRTSASPVAVRRRSASQAAEEWEAF
ncbi:methyl-accepting chemotaxis protein [Halomonas sp. WWR20]